MNVDPVVQVVPEIDAVNCARRVRGLEGVGHLSFGAFWWVGSSGIAEVKKKERNKEES